VEKVKGEREGEGHEETEEESYIDWSFEGLQELLLSEGRIKND
jgi:hypothetical protein